jgi:hypothetical protein
VIAAFVHEREDHEAIAVFAIMRERKSQEAAIHRRTLVVRSSVNARVRQRPSMAGCCCAFVRERKNQEAAIHGCTFSKDRMIQLIQR